MAVKGRKREVSARDSGNSRGGARGEVSDAASSVISLRLFELLPRHPMLTVTRAMELLETSKPTALKAITTMESCGLLCEQTGRQRDRSWAFGEYGALLAEGTEV